MYTVLNCTLFSALSFHICDLSVTYSRYLITQWYSQVLEIVLRLYSSAVWCPNDISPSATASTTHFRCAHAIFKPRVWFIFISEM